ncbi:MAG TPA: aldo/keto reductase [Candidatus Bathyarchaeia archaeon]|nr:aldo/keto reductase [Candidatus Bathyarchaeia archaeon]
MEFKTLGTTGVQIPVLGLGTWGIGGLMSSNSENDEIGIQAIRLGLDLGMRFVDTAEMYGRGHSEEVVAEATKDQRESIFLATKVSAEHLAYDDVLRSCQASLKRLQTRYLDLYQVHWPNTRMPLSETMKAMEHLVDEGKVRHIGVSNFSVRQLSEAQEGLSKIRIVSNQVEYSLTDRSIERDLLPFAEKEKITIIAYSPLARGQIPGQAHGDRWKILDQIARITCKTRSQVALNWLLLKPPVVAIPKASNLDHLRENSGSVGWSLTEEQEKRLDEAFK